jgi:hypothetical protein
LKRTLWYESRSLRSKRSALSARRFYEDLNALQETGRQLLSHALVARGFLAHSEFRIGSSDCADPHIVGALKDSPDSIVLSK